MLWFQLETYQWPPWSCCARGDLDFWKLGHLQFQTPLFWKSSLEDGTSFVNHGVLAAQEHFPYEEHMSYVFELHK